MLTTTQPAEQAKIEPVRFHTEDGQVHVYRQQGEVILRFPVSNSQAVELAITMQQARALEGTLMERRVYDW